MLALEGTQVILATGRYLGEGFDDERLDTLFLALPISWRGTLTQYAGRLHRFYFLKEPTQDRQIQLPEKESKDAKDLMLAIKERLDEISGRDKLLPAHECGECEYCQ